VLRQYWCWIGDRYKTEQFLGQYVWLWITMIVSFLTYTPLFFWARGIITVSSSHWWKFQVHKKPVLVIDPDGMKRRSIAMISFVILLSPKLLQDLTPLFKVIPSYLSWLLSH
jgi:hypothetical protein